jgi:hypothetical protein
VLSDAAANATRARGMAMSYDEIVAYTRDQLEVLATN